MPSAQLNLYRFVEDAWSGGLRAWCEGGGESWILVGNAGQARWLLRKFAEAGIAGVSIFDPDGLREELARRAGIDPLPPDAVAAFAARVAAGDAVGNPGTLAEACDALARAGWHLNQLGVDPAVGRRLHRTLDRSALPAGIRERRLRDALPVQAVRLCCVGWDATHWPDLGLLNLAADKAQSCEVYLPSPRLPADALHREWIEAIEQRLGLKRVTCPESGFASQNEPLVARLDNSGLASRAEARAPDLLVGREWPDEVGLVCGQVAKWLAGAPTPGLPIGIIAPEDSPTAVAVAEALEKAGFRVEHPGRRREPEGAHLVLEQVARYHLSGHDIGELIELARLLRLHVREAWSALEPAAVQEAVGHAFRVAQSRNARILAQAQPHRKDALWAAARELVEALGRWDGEFAWPALREKWNAMLEALHLPTGVLSIRWDGLFEEERIPARAFIEWLADHLAAQRQRNIAPPDYAALAPVVVTSFAGAAQQTWASLIFLDSNEHVWPAPILENPYLPDATRTRLNRNRQESGRLLTTHDLHVLEQARFLDLLEHCRGPIAFAGVLLEQTETGGAAQPNEWVLRSLIETAGDSFAPDLWPAAARSCPSPAPPALDEVERAHLERVNSSRRNGTMPFDRYLFNFNETKLEPEAWSATDLDQAVTCPATFALKELLGASAPEPLFRAEGAAVGNRAHRWLGRILGLSDHLAAPGPASADAAKLAQELAAARRELDEWYGAEGLAAPIWWETCLRKTAWATRRCLREVRGSLEAGYCAMEQRLALAVQTPAGPLLLKGRIDILISDRREIPGASVRLFDFKTGRGAAPTLSTLERGQGAQFAAYYLMARDAGAAEAVIGIIKPEDRARDVFTKADEPALRARFGVLAELRRTLRFGRRGALVSDYAPCEALPMATIPIDPAILEQKAGLFLLAQ